MRPEFSSRSPEPCWAVSLEVGSSGPVQEAQEEAQAQDMGHGGDEVALSRGAHMLSGAVGNKCQILGEPRCQVPGDGWDEGTVTSQGSESELRGLRHCKGGMEASSVARDGNLPRPGGCPAGCPHPPTALRAL